MHPYSIILPEKSIENGKRDRCSGRKRPVKSEVLENRIVSRMRRFGVRLLFRRESVEVLMF